MLRGRVRTTTHLYDDPEHPDRVTGTLESPEYTEDDRILLLALEHADLTPDPTKCPGCGIPIEQAWHTDLNGWWEAPRFVCYPCTEVKRSQDDGEGDGKPVSYAMPTLTYDKPLTLLEAFQLGVTTEAPG